MLEDLRRYEEVIRRLISRFDVEEDELESKVIEYKEQASNLREKVSALEEAREVSADSDQTIRKVLTQQRLWISR
jgi:predicted RNase H-like nuclease (RuvC/YqgF family)